MHQTHNGFVIHLQFKQCLSSEEVSFDKARVDLKSLSAILQRQLPLFQLEVTQSSICVEDRHARITELNRHKLLTAVQEPGYCCDVTLRAAMNSPTTI